MTGQVKEKGPFVIEKSTFRDCVRIRFEKDEWFSLRYPRRHRGDIVRFVEWLNKRWAERETDD